MTLTAARSLELTAKQKLLECEAGEIRSTWHCIYSVRFWQFFSMMILSNVFGTFFSYSYKVYGENQEPHPPISDTTLTWAASIGSGLVNGVSRITLGAVVDRVGFKKLFAFLMAIQLINSLTCYWAAFIPSVYFACVMLNYMSLGGMFAIFPVAVTNVFGLATGPKIYVWILLGTFIASLIILIETTYLEDLLGFAALFYFGSVTQIATLIILYYYKEELDVERLRKHNALCSQTEEED